MRLLRRTRTLQLLLIFLVVNSTSLFARVKSTVLRVSDLIELASYDDEGLCRALKKSAGYFRFEIDHDHLNAARTYENLQSNIAELIPREFERPEISITFKMSSRDAEQSPLELGIIGGIGPLSDARILHMLISKLAGLDFPGDLNISLLSLPPPRQFFDKVRYGIRYAVKVAKFSRKHSLFFLASNTAHIHWQGITCLAGSRPRVHLPRRVAHLISIDAIYAKTQIEKVLVLDTLLAKKHCVYQTALIRENCSFVSLSDPEHRRLEDWIKRIKTNGAIEKDEEELATFILGLAHKYQTSTILLACTELSLGLAESVAAWRKNEYRVYDSEKIFVGSILSYISNRWT